MNIIVPMAGRGSRLRPHTLTTPKPLVKVGGKPIVQRLVEDIAKISTEKIDEIAFIIGDFGKQVETDLLDIASSLGATGKIYHQTEPLGTAHAVHCAKESLHGPVIIAFADTLFRANFTIDPNVDGILWVKQIEDPSAFGVVKMNDQGHIVEFVEKPKEFVSDLAMIGVYYFKYGEKLKEEIDYLIEHDIIKGGEYQLPDALRNLTQKNYVFVPGEVSAWMDCGNKAVTVETNQRILDFDHEDGINNVEEHQNENSVIIQPCFIGKNVKIVNSVVGPNVSIGEHSVVTDSRIANSIIGEETIVKGVYLKNSMIGNKAEVNGKSQDLSIGDYSKIEL
ncbi:MAG: nucleotidyltransferase [Crocinitomicaceae bacterium]|nr:nucleotidyltransferase [Crocinitomicaceae bacterium]